MTLEQRRLRPVLLLATCLALLTACAPGGPFNDREAPVGPHVPTGPASSLTPHRGEGQTVDLEGAGTLVVPEGSTVEDTIDMGDGGRQLNIRMPGADDEGLPALQASWGPDHVGVFEQTLTSQHAASVNPTMSDYVRSMVQWPGSAESVVATWEEDIALTDGSTLPVSALRLTVQGDDAVTVVVLALAPRGELDGSAVEQALRSLELD